MSNGRDIKSIDQEIDHVRVSIERCMQMYMNRRETMSFLAAQGNILPELTRIVWARLEQDNPHFFRAFYVMLAVQQQIIEFNRLLPAQAELMRRIGLTGNTNMFNSSLPQTAQRMSTSYVHLGSRIPQQENMQQVYVLNNNGPSIPTRTQGNVVHRPSFQIREINVSTNVFVPQYPIAGLEQMANGQILGRGRSDLSFVGPSNFMGSNPLRGDAFVPHFDSNNNAQHLEGFHSNNGHLGQNGLNSAVEYPVDLSGSAGVPLSSNPQHLDNFIFRYGAREQYQPTPTTEYPVDYFRSNGNAEMLNPRSNGSSKNPFSG